MGIVVIWLMVEKMLLKLFIEFFKIGLFSFGGGYGMLALMQETCVEKNNWLDKEEFMNVVAVAESTPGPIAVNLSTYVGYKNMKLIGAIISTIGVCAPSMIIIGLISIYFEDFLQIQLVKYAFTGVRIAVSILLIDIAIRLLKNEIKSSPNKKFTISLFVIFTIFLIIQNIIQFSFSSIYFILIAAVIGFMYHVITNMNNKDKNL